MMTDLKAFLRKLHKNLNILHEREAKYGGNTPLDLLNQIEDHQKAIVLTEQAIAGELTEAEWDEALKPLLVSLEKAQVIIDQQSQQVDTQFNVAGDLIINYPPPPAPTVAEADIPAAEEPIPDNPYLGLFYFRPEHAHLFFGRETFTQKLVLATNRRPLVAVLGASGSGKSSVVFAGLVPALRNRSDDKWLFTYFRPGDDPFFGLANALVPLLDPDLSKSKQTGEARDLATRLREDRSPLADYLTTIHQTHPDHRLLIISDQFEELYTLCRDNSVRQQFMDVLLTMVGVVQGPSPRLVLTLRADFLGQASLYRPFADALQGTTELLGPMTRAEMAEAIEKPAELQGVHFEAKLVDRILDDVGDAEGSLPLLEFALTELWQHQKQRTLTHVAYNEIGEIKGALSRHADKAYQRLRLAEQEQARRVFVQLVNPGAGTEDTRRLASRTELETSWSLVAKLANERLVVTNQAEDTQDTVEVVHEALIRHWKQLRDWMEKDRDFRTWQERLRFALGEWEDTQDDDVLLRGAPLAEAEGWLAERSEDLSQTEQTFINASLAERRKQERRQRLLLGGAIAAAVVMTVLAGLSLWFFGDANRQRATAEAASTAVAQQLAAAEEELGFSRSNTPEERLAHLARLVELGRGDLVGKLLSGLPTRAEQSAVFKVKDERLVGVIREIYVSLADVNRTGYGDSLLQAMVEGLANLPETTAETATRPAELELWLQARQQAREGRYKAALDEYDQLMALNEHNPAVLYERARVLAGLGMYKKALEALDRVLDLMNDTPSLVATEQMPQAIGRLIYWVEPELGALFDHSRADYPHLAESSARLTETREVKRVLVEAGPFEMGSENGQDDEKPVHTVTLEDFNIDQYEVTNAQYAACVDADVCDPPLSASSSTREGYYGNPEYADYPVISVDWYQAGAYCDWRGGQLPTEAQWEKAARGTDGRTYPWGEEIDCTRANIHGCEGDTRKVGSHPAGVSPYGAYDMAGNVWEWVADAYDGEYYKNSPRENPLGPDHVENIRAKVLRGGSWSYNDFLARASYRIATGPGDRAGLFGFRCVAAAP